MYKKYLSAINELINVALKLNGNDEVRRIAIADERLARDRFVSRVMNKFRKGEIYQFEFGRNYFPEMSFEHRGLIIGVKGKLLYVLPICSYNLNEESHRNAYHPTDHPDKKEDFYLLKSSEFPFIKHDSVIKLSDLRTVSVNRKLYKHQGGFDITSDIYKEIESLVLQKYFHKFYYDYSELQKEFDILQNELIKVKEEKKSIEIKMQDYITAKQSSNSDNEPT